MKGYNMATEETEDNKTEGHTEETDQAKAVDSDGDKDDKVECPGCLERDATIEVLARRNGELVAENFENMRRTGNDDGDEDEPRGETKETTLEEDFFEVKEG